MLNTDITLNGLSLKLALKSTFSILDLENRGKISQLSEIAQKIYYMQNLPMNMNFNKNYDHMQFAALWPKLLSNNPISFFLRLPVKPNQNQNSLKSMTSNHIA